MARRPDVSMLRARPRGGRGFFAVLYDFGKRIFGHLDPVVLGVMVFLNLMSILTLYGGIENFGKSRLVMQIAMTIVGFIMMTVISHLDYRFIVHRYWLVMIIFSIVFLALPILFGTVQGGNKSWITVLKFGDTTINIQPSEFVKLTFICTFSWHLSSVAGRINRPKVLIPVALHAGVILGLILLSGDLGVALVYCGIILFMLFAAGMSLWYDLGLFAAITVAFPFLWDLLAEYQQERILVGFRPELDPLGKGYQPLLSRDGILHGGWFGHGVFGGEVYEELPASHTDFIFSTVCEKFGFFGGLLVIFALGLLVWRILRLSLETRDGLGKLILVGVAAMVVVQSIENIGMCLAKLPVVGITLPFLSYGGSSILAIYLLFGVLHSVASHGRRRV